MLLPNQTKRSKAPRRCGVYVLAHVVSGRSYVGRTVDIERRMREHQHPTNDMLISQELRRYGWDAFTFKVIEGCSEADLDAREAHWIASLGTLHPTGLNHRSGGRRNEKCSAAVRTKISNALIGKQRTPEHQARLDAARAGVRHTAAARAKMSAAHTGAKRSPEACAAMADAQRRRWAAARASTNVSHEVHHAAA